MSRGTGIVKTGKQHPLRLKIKNIRGSDREEQERLSKQASKALDDEEEYYKKRDKLKEDILNELTGKSQIRNLRSKAVEASNKAFWHGNKMKTGEIKAAHAAAGQAERLVMADSSQKGGRAKWLKQAKKKGDQKRTWRKRLKESKDVTLSGKNSIEPDISKKQETWKMNKELKNAIANAIKASRAQIISTYGKPIHPGKVNPNLNEHVVTKVRRILKKG